MTLIGCLPLCYAMALEDKPTSPDCDNTTEQNESRSSGSAGMNQDGGAVKCEILPPTLYLPPQIKEFRNLVEFFKNPKKSTRISSN